MLHTKALQLTANPLGTLLDALTALGLEIIIDQRGKASAKDLGRLF